MVIHHYLLGLRGNPPRPYPSEEVVKFILYQTDRELKTEDRTPDSKDGYIGFELVPAPTLTLTKISACLIVFVWEPNFHDCTVCTDACVSFDVKQAFGVVINRA